MKELLFFLTLTTSFSLHSQNLVSIEAFGALGVGKSPNDFFDQFSQQKAVPLSRFGVGASIPISGNFFLRTGVQLNEYGFKTDDLITTDINGVDQGNTVFESRNQQAELLVLARYELPTGGSVVPFLEAGLVPTMYIHTKDNFTPDLPIEAFDPDLGEASYQMEGVRKFNSTARVGAGAAFKMSPAVNVFTGVVYQRYLASFAEEGLANIYPWRVDVEVGVRYFLGS